VGRLVEHGRRAPVVCASAGNFGQGMAYACRKRGVPITVFAAHGANPLKLARMRALGAEVRIAGADLDEAKQTARAWAAERSARFVEDGFEPHVSEGAGSIALELLAGGDAFDAVVVPLGDGALLNGMARWIKAASPATRVIGVCSTGAPAMLEAWRRGLRMPDELPATRTIADGIAVRAPIAASLDDMRGTVDDILAVDDAALVEAMRALHAHAGLVTEPAGVAGLARAGAAAGCRRSARRHRDLRRQRNRRAAGRVRYRRSARSMRICFVCLGNICRSPTAQGVMERLVADAGLAGRIAIDSAGTAAYHVSELPDEHARAAARRRGIGWPTARASSPAPTSIASTSCSRWTRRPRPAARARRRPRRAAGRPVARL